MYSISVRRIIYALWMILLFISGLAIVYKTTTCDIVEVSQESPGALPYDDLDAGALE